MRTRNPFKPSAGAPPPLLVGRQEDVDSFVESIEDGPGAPGRLTIFTGPRGVGKTVMLTEVSGAVEQLGWVCIEDTATSGLIERLTMAIDHHLERFDPDARTGRHLTGVNVPGGLGASFTPPAQVTMTFRDRIVRLLDILEGHETGLLITVDEIQHDARGELRELATTIQHLVRDERNIAFAFAGLSSALTSLLSDKVLTFLRRADRIELHDVPLVEVRGALAKTLHDNGMTIDDAALDEATAATGGYPFMIQLVGYHVWRKARDGHVDLAAVREGVPAARKRLGATVHQSAFADLSDVDRTYLLAMAQDDGPSRTADLADRMGETAGYANVYRTRLIEAGVIEAVDRGLVDFAIPYMREYLREHAARYEMERHLRGR